MKSASRLGAAGVPFKQVLVLVTLAFTMTSAHAAGIVAPTGEGAQTRQSSSPSSPKSSNEVFVELLESVILGTSHDQLVVGTDGKITYGAEKEASSSLITRVMGPNMTEFRNYLKRLGEAERATFLRDFLTGWVRGTYRVNQVEDVDGIAQVIDLSQFNAKAIQTMGLDELTQTFDRWLLAAGDRSFSFIKPAIRRKIFDGKLPGQAGQAFGVTYLGSNQRTTANFYSWVPLFGLAQKYIDNAHNTSVGWEINFLPMPNLAEFEKMQNWFSEALKNAGERFGSPGHQRMVFPKRYTGLGEEQERAKLENKMAEFYKNLQAFLLLRSQEGLARMETANFKNVQSDSQILRLRTGRGLFRLEQDRFVPNSYGIEMRAGTKSEATRRFAQMALAARYSSDDFSGLADARSWKLIPDATTEASDLVRRFGVPRTLAERAIHNLTSPTIFVRDWDRSISIEYITPFWQWENAPYLSSQKRAQLVELTQAFILSVASWENPSTLDIQKALQAWAIASNLTADIRQYLEPAPQAAAETQQLLEYKTPEGAAVDVNRIDLGIEYSARYPLKLSANYAQVPLLSQRSGWLSTQFDLSREEKSELLRKVALRLRKELGGGGTEVTQSSESLHGHSLDLAWEFKDARGREFCVEWDGIGRDYDPQGEIWAGSVRGGHIELVTPKFVPTAQDIEAIYRAFAAYDLIPSAKAGGGHINVDLAPFENNPKALARLIKAFHSYRGIIALMFQHPSRLRSAEPVDLSPKLNALLTNFNGTSAELKQALYNERYFNTRVGRKSRYIQMDLSAYFQDVIPEQFVGQDFDIKNEVWRRNFNVDPKIRKAEFRMFNAPADPQESALQIKLVRALLNFAFNGDEPTRSDVQAVDYASYVSDPSSALSDLEQLCATLGLDSSEYKRFVLLGLQSAESYLESAEYLPLEAQMKAFPRTEGWEVAVAPRGPSEQLKSEGRIPTLPPTPDMLAMKLYEDRLKDRETLQTLRQRAPTPREARTLSREAGDAFLRELMVLRNRSILSDDDALFVIYGSLGGPKALKARTALEKIRANSVRLDRAVARALDVRNPQFRSWLLTLIRPGIASPETDQRLASDSDASFRAFAYEKRFGSYSKAQFVRALDGALLSPKFEVALDALSRIEKMSVERWDRGARVQLVTRLLRLTSQHAKLSTRAVQLLARVSSGIGTATGINWGRLGNSDAQLLLLKDVMSRPDFDDLSSVLALMRSADANVRKETVKLVLRKWAPRLVSSDRSERAQTYADLRSEDAFSGKIILASGALDSVDEVIVGEALVALRNLYVSSGINDPELSSRVLRLAQGHAKAQVRQLARRALVAVASSELVVEAMSGAFSDFRQQIASDFGVLVNRYDMNPSGLLPLLDLTEDADPRVRELAIDSLLYSSRGTGLGALLLAKVGVDDVLRRRADAALQLLLASPEIADQFRAFDSHWGGVHYEGAIGELLKMPGAHRVDLFRAVLQHAEHFTSVVAVFEQLAHVDTDTFIAVTHDFVWQSSWYANETTRSFIAEFESRDFGARKQEVYARYLNLGLMLIATSDTAQDMGEFAERLLLGIGSLPQDARRQLGMRRAQVSNESVRERITRVLEGTTDLSECVSALTGT